MQLLTGAIGAPNRIALEEQKGALYVSGTEAGTIGRFRHVLGPEGDKLTQATTFATPGPGADGLALDREKRLCAARDGRVGVYSVNDEVRRPTEPLCELPLADTHVPNVAVADDELFVTATDRIFVLTIGR